MGPWAPNRSLVNVLTPYPAFTVEVPASPLRKCTPHSLYRQPAVRRMRVRSPMPERVRHSNAIGHSIVRTRAVAPQALRSHRVRVPPREVGYLSQDVVPRGAEGGGASIFLMGVQDSTAPSVGRNQRFLEVCPSDPIQHRFLFGYPIRGASSVHRGMPCSCPVCLHSLRACSCVRHHAS